ncbi:MAG: GNAT family N-acetyltransferase [Legionellaceae bacterium]|nr:GNAT family N-acetyltransferase [Legionellaceae bacterium]
MLTDSIKISEINKQDVDEASITLFHAFRKDPLIQWIYNDQWSYETRGLAILRTWVKYCMLYGKAFKTNNLEAVVLRKKPGDEKLTFWHMLRSGMLSTPAILGKEAFSRLMEFDNLMMQERKRNMDDKIYWYCWMLGTKPECQNQGFANALMKYTFDMAKKIKITLLS